MRAVDTDIAALERGAILDPNLQLLETRLHLFDLPLTEAFFSFRYAPLSRVIHPHRHDIKLLLLGTGESGKVSYYSGSVQCCQDEIILY